MGRDQVQDRLHPIRIEVALVTREMCPNWPIGLATMLSAVAWEASNTVNDPTYIQLNSSVEPPQISDKILEALSSRKIPSVFYSTHTNGAPNSNQDGFDIIQMPSRACYPADPVLRLAAEPGGPAGPGQRPVRQQ